MSDFNHHAPALSELLRRTLTTGLGALRNRSELLAIEVEEERQRFISLFFWGIGAAFLAAMAVALFTGTIIFLFPREYRLYAAAGLGVIYLTVAVVIGFNLRAMMRSPAFSETMAQFKKDDACLKRLR
jgi:uncharacterized membrane protein YqjE